MNVMQGEHMDSTIMEVEKTCMADADTMTILRGLVPDHTKPTTHIVPTGQLELVGDWQVMIFVKWTCNKAKVVLEESESRCCAFVWNVLTTCVLLAAFVYFACYLVREPFDHVSHSTWITAIIVEFLIVLHIVFMCVRLWHGLKGGKEHERFAKIFSGLRLIFAGACLYACILFVYGEHDLFGLAFLVLVLGTILLHTLLFVLFCALSPFVVLLLVGEFIVQILICRLRCPHLKAQTRVFEYTLFKYRRAFSSGVPQCPMCGQRYNRNEACICIVECKTDHLYHEKCVLEWVTRENCCPVCKGPDVKFKLLI